MHKTSIWHKLMVLWHMHLNMLYNAIGLTNIRCRTWQHYIRFLLNEFFDTCSFDFCHWRAWSPTSVVDRHIVCAKCRHDCICQPVTWTSHHCHTVPEVVNKCQLLTLSVVPTKKCVTYKQDQFSEWVTVLNCCSCASVHMPHILLLWKLEPYVIYVSSIWNFSVLNKRNCKLFSSTLMLFKMSTKLKKVLYCKINTVFLKPS